MPRWLDIARKEMGQAEVPGKGTNQRIVDYHSSTALHATDDETPWCSSFVNWCFRKAGIDGTYNAAAKSWIAWGQESVPMRGAVVVLHSKSGGGYHVGFFVDSTPTSVRLLGGNQGNRVKESTFELSRFDIVAVRWPEEVPDAA